MTAQSDRNLSVFQRIQFVRRRRNQTILSYLYSVTIALVLAFLVCSLIFLAADASPIEAFSNLLFGAFGNVENFLETLVRATPLILTGLATTIAFRARLWNIGQEGQFFAGAMTAYWGGVYLAGWPIVLSLPLILLMGFAGGALVGTLAGILKTRFDVNEVITTVMCNYIVFYLLTYLLSGPWTDPNTVYQQTARLDASLRFPLLIEASRLHFGFVVAILAALVLHLAFTRMPLGFKIRAIGENPRAAMFKGIPVERTIVLVLLLSGGVAGLAGASELFGLQYRLKTDLSGNFGFTGIVIAMLGGLRPLGVVLAAILFGGLSSGSFMMQVATGVPTSVIYAIQAIVLLFFLCSTVIARYEIKLVKSNG